MDMQVVRNIPSQTAAVIPQTPPIDAKGKKVILYQGAVNLGRGIEWMIDAMPYLDDCVLYVVGDGDLLQELKERVSRLNLNEQVIFTGRVPFEALPAYTACADIGVNLLENKGLNYYYSLPNRIFDYMRMHIPVLAVDFPEIRRMVAHYEIGTLVNHHEPQFLAETIRQMLAQGKNEAGFAAANAELSWENESKTVLKVIREALNEPEKEMERIAENCMREIREIDYNRLNISDYNRKYIQNIIPHIHYYFRIYMQAVACFSNFQPGKNRIVDFGGGHGFLSLFLKSLGYQTVYCDINPLSVKTISLIKEEVGFGPDFIVAGSVAELKRFSIDNHLIQNNLIATDLIEHVYDLQDFFRQLQQINPCFEMVFTTGSNPENPYKCRQLRRYMAQTEKVYFTKRKAFIQTNADHLTETETNTLAKLSRGKIYPDILKMLNAYQETGKFPPAPDDDFNTCDPETGNWAERILSLKTYKQLASEAGFRANFIPGFYNEERNLKILSLVFRLLNFCIRKSGKFGFKLAPYLLIKLSPK
jgi:2-polyprenyl-3-methyl-5-hydroxy-6-metoxy-1,4-benzoquinol methylase